MLAQGTQERWTLLLTDIVVATAAVECYWRPSRCWAMQCKTSQTVKPAVDLCVTKAAAELLWGGKTYVGQDHTGAVDS